MTFVYNASEQLFFTTFVITLYFLKFNTFPPTYVSSDLFAENTNDTSAQTLRQVTHTHERTPMIQAAHYYIYIYI